MERYSLRKLEKECFKLQRIYKASSRGDASSTQTSESSEEVLSANVSQYVESPRIIKEKRRQVDGVKS